MKIKFKFIIIRLEPLFSFCYCFHIPCKPNKTFQAITVNFPTRISVHSYALTILCELYFDIDLKSIEQTTIIEVMKFNF